MESEVEPVLAVTSKSKVKELTQVVWCSFEEPLVLAPCEFQATKRTNKSGYLMVTFGAVYIFKSKLVKADILYYKLHLLDMRKVVVSPTKIVLELASLHVTIKVKSAPAIARVMKSVLYQCTWGLTDVLTAKFVDDGADLGKLRITQRPKDALRKRCLFMCHFYDKRGDTLDQVKYFDKYDRKVGPTLVVSGHFHPGNFAPAVGHAIAWETRLKTVSFCRFKPVKFTLMFQAMLNNAKTIERIVFMNYNKDKTAEFALKGLEEGSVKEFWFMECDKEMIRAFLTAAQQYPCGIEELCFVSCRLAEGHIAWILQTIEKLRCCRTLKTLSFMKIPVQNFPRRELTRCLESLPNLETFTANELACDAAPLLTAICQPQVKVNIVNIHNMTFRTGMSTKEGMVTSRMVMLSVNKCSFTQDTLKSFFGWLVKKNEGHALIFQAQHLRIRPDDLQFFQAMKFDSVASNLCEFDWTGNPIPRQYAKYFYAFLATQKQLRILVLNEMRSMEKLGFDVRDFFKMLFNHITKTTLPGLDISGPFDPQAFAEFLQMMSEAKFMRRLCVRCENGGDVVGQALTDLVNKLPSLCEVAADGQKPASKAVFFGLWEAIMASKSIRANDFPQADIANFGWKTFNKEHASLLAQLRNERQQPSSILKRAEFTVLELRRLRTTGQVTQSTDIFLQTSNMQYIDSGLDDEVRELQTQHHEFGADEEVTDSPLVPSPAGSQVIPDPNMAPTALEDVGDISELRRTQRTSSGVLRGMPPMPNTKTPVKQAPQLVPDVPKPVSSGSRTHILAPVPRRRSSFNGPEKPRRHSSLCDSDA